MNRKLLRPGAASILAIALLLVTPGMTADGERVEVFGRGYAATSRPADTTAPPPGFTSPATEQDPEVGEFFAGPGDYVVRDGPMRVLPRKSDLTDYVHWTVYGATLIAEGQVADKDPATATIVSSDAWGQEEISVSVACSEGGFATLEAENQIGFNYSYLISGSSIAEASVQLTGNAYDLHKKCHQFQLSEHSGESVTSSTESKTGVEATEYKKLSATYSTNKKSGGATVGGEFGATTSEHDTLAVKITRRFGKSDGSNGSSPALTIRDFRSGNTPLSHTYQVNSDGTVQLAARAGPGGSVFVRLSEFKIKNTLRVWKTVHSTYVTPPGSDPGQGGGPTSGGGGGGGDCGGGTPGSGSAGGSGAAPAAPGPAADPPPSSGALRSTARAPHGLAGEAGALPGVLTVPWPCPAPTDLHFAVESIPEGALDLFASRLTVPQGGRGGALHFEARHAGSATIRLTPIGSDGLPGPSAVECVVDCTSVMSHAEPRIWVGTHDSPWTPASSRTVRLVAGQQASLLHVGRLGFRGWDSEATAVSLTVDDPDALLRPLPSVVLIPAATEHVTLPLATGDADGSALLTFVAGAERTEITVVVCRQRWEETATIRIPAGALGRIPFRVAFPEERRRAVAASLSAPGVIAFAAGDHGGGGESCLLAGETAWEIGAAALQRGRVDVTLTSPGLAPQVVTVLVVPASVEIGGGALRLLDLHEVSGGALGVSAPAGMRFASATLPPEAGDLLAVRGVGTGTLVVEMRGGEGAAVPDILEIAFTMDGTPAADAVYEVKDCLRRTEAQGSLPSYRIQVR